MLPLVIGSLSHDCMHDHVVRRRRVVVSPQRRTARRRLSTDLQPLRLVFNSDTMTDDPRACTSVGQTVAIGDPPTASTSCSSSATIDGDCYYRCSAVDVITDENRLLVTDVLLPAVAAWFGAALRIRTPVEGALSVANEPCGFGGASARYPRWHC